MPPGRRSAGSKSHFPAWPGHVRFGVQIVDYRQTQIGLPRKVPRVSSERPPDHPQSTHQMQSYGRGYRLIFVAFWRWS